MFINYFKIKRIKSVFFVIFLIQALLWGMFPGKANFNQYEEEAVLVTVTSDHNSCSETSVWYLQISEWPDSMCDGSMFAVLFRFELSDGWRISSVQGTEENTLLTWGDNAILLEGSITVGDQSDPSMILRIDVQKYAETEHACYLELINDEKNKNMIYYTDETGCVSTYPYRICNLQGETADTEITEIPDTDKTLDETETRFFEDTKPIQWDLPVYAGCQETRVEGEIYSVRFLFVGKGAPVICMEGSGLLSMKLTYTETVDEWMGTRVKFYATESSQVWSVCTFRNLSVYRNYEFFVYTQNEIIRIRYTNGNFMGVDQIDQYV